MKIRMGTRGVRLGLSLILIGGFAIGSSGFARRVQVSNPVADIQKRLGGLRGLDDVSRAKETRALAIEIKNLSPSSGQLNLAYGLANLATEGDFGRDTLQAVTDALASAAASLDSLPSVGDRPAVPEQMRSAVYDELAQLSRLEGMKVRLKNAGYGLALRRWDELESQRAKADFTLTDLEGHQWTRSGLKGKVVLVNFWATWCPPCRKEMPDLDALYARFKGQGFVILAISDETEDKVKKFITDNGYHYPVMLDPGRKVNELYKVAGIPKSFIYNRSGKLVAETIDMRTKAQFLALLAKAGLK